MAYKKDSYTVEIHFASGDVLHKDYGRDQGCAMRAIERLAQHLKTGVTKFDALRLWHGNKCLMDKQAHSIIGGPELCADCGGIIGYDAWVDSKGEVCGGPFQQSQCMSCERENPPVAGATAEGGDQ